MVLRPWQLTVQSHCELGDGFSTMLCLCWKPPGILDPLCACTESVLPHLGCAMSGNEGVVTHPSGSCAPGHQYTLSHDSVTCHGWRQHNNVRRTQTQPSIRNTSSAQTRKYRQRQAVWHCRSSNGSNKLQPLQQAGDSLMQPVHPARSTLCLF